MATCEHCGEELFYHPLCHEHLRNADGYGKHWINLCRDRLKAQRDEARDDERAHIAAWLRRDSTRKTEPAAWDYADAIERGEHDAKETT
jgi:hypothetical protein